MKKADIKVLREEEWQIERDMVLKKRKVYVLKNKESYRDTCKER